MVDRPTMPASEQKVITDKNLFTNTWFLFLEKLYRFSTDPTGGITYADLFAVAPITYDGAGTYSTSMATNKLIGRYTAGTGVMEQISLDPATLVLSAGVLTAIGATPSGAAGGDLSSLYPDPTVAKINGVALGSTTATSGNLLIGSSTAWVTQSVSGDATLNSTGILTLATVNSNVGTFGSATQVPQFTVNAKGLVTAVTDVTITGLTPGQLTLNSGQIIVGDVSNVGAAVSMSGDATINSTGVLTIANLAVTNAKIANTTIDLTTKVTGILPNSNTTATSANTNSAIVARDGSGNFSAGTITATLTGNAATASKWITARNLAGNSVDGSANVAFANKFIVQGTTDAGLSAAQFLGALGTGIVKNTTTTGVLSIAAAASDYVAPSAYASANGLTMATARLLGRTTASSGAAEEISIGSGLTLSAGTLTATGTGGTVTTVSVVSANGFAGTVANPTTTPAITISTSITGILKGNGTAISAASAGSDYEVPLTFSTGLTRLSNTVTVNTSQNITKLSNLTSNGFVKTSGGDGTLSVDTSTYALDSAVVHNTGNESIAGIKTFSSFPQIPQTNMVFVSNSGSDSNGNGSATAPYATPSHALSVITATVTNPYCIFLESGAYTESGGLVLKPNVYIECNGSKITLSGNITLDSTFLSNNSYSYIRDGYFNLGLNSFVFDVSTKNNSINTSFLLDNINPIDGSTHSFTLTASSHANILDRPTTLQIRNCFREFSGVSSASQSISVTNINFQILNTSIFGSSGGLTVQNTSSTLLASMSCRINNCSITAPLILRTTGTQQLTSAISGMGTFPSSWTIDGTNSIVKMYSPYDVAPTLANSATFSPASLYAGSITYGSFIKTTDTTVSTSTTTGSLIAGGGAGIAGKAYIGGALNVTDTTSSTSTTTGSGIFGGGVGIAGDQYLGGKFTTGAPGGTPTIPALLNLYSTTQNLSRITLTGQEYFAASNTTNEGIALLLGINRAASKQLWITDSSYAKNATNPAFRVWFTSATCTIGTVSTDGTVALPLTISATDTTLSINNLGINGTSFGSGVGVVFITNATTVPTTNPTGGGILYVTGGALKYKGSSGTVTNLANA